MTEPSARRIGKYEIVSVMGRGAMGVIYRANDATLGRQVAIKTLSGVLPDDAELRLRFVREARSIGQLHHPNVVTVHEFFEEGGTAYLVMEALTGASLFRLLRKEKKWDLEQKLSILLQIAAGLDAAHAHQIVHRDLKPSNVFVETRGVVKILDFGVAKVGEGGLTQAGSIFGTIEYMAPEQLRAEEVDRRADVFSWGVVAYELLSGRNPFRADTPAASVFKLVSDDPESLCALGVPAEIDLVVRRALAKKRDDRFSSMAEAAAALTQAATDLELTPTLPLLSHEEVGLKASAADGMSFGSEAQWTNIAVAVGQLEKIYRDGIERFSSGDFHGCVERMSQVLDEAQVHSLALHYLTQAEDKLRQQRLDATRRREVNGLLAYMRRAHQQGESLRVIETARKVLALDPESMEARWYRRTSEQRMTPSLTRHAVSPSATLRRFANVAMRKEEPLVLESLPIATPSSGVAYWYAAAAAALLLGVMGFAWVFTGTSRAQASAARERAGSKPPAGSRLSVFDSAEDDSVVSIVLPSNTAPPTIRSAFPSELSGGEESEVLVSGQNFHPQAKVVLIHGDRSMPLAEVLSSTVTNDSLIHARLRVVANPSGAPVVLAVEQPNGNRSAEFALATR